MNLQEKLHAAEVLVRHAGIHLAEGRQNLAGQKTARAVDLLASLNPKELVRQNDETIAIALSLTADCTDIYEKLMARRCRNGNQQRRTLIN